MEVSARVMVGASDRAVAKVLAKGMLKASARDVPKVSGKDIMACISAEATGKANAISAILMTVIFPFGGKEAGDMSLTTAYSAGGG